MEKDLKTVLLVVGIVMVVIVIVIGGIIAIATWRLGVFEPSPIKASSGFNEFSVGTYFKIETGGTAQIVAKNIDIESRAVIVNSASVDGQICTGDPEFPASIEAGRVISLTCTGVSSGNMGETYMAIPVVIEYRVGGGTYTETGHLSGRYE